MDLDLLKSDLDEAFAKIPSDMLSELSAFVFRHKDTFGTVIPALMEELFPHIRAVMMEKAMGILDVKEVEDAVMEVLGRHGVKPALPPAIGDVKKTDDGRLLQWTGQHWIRLSA